jgi:hypothetical protein
MATKFLSTQGGQLYFADDSGSPVVVASVAQMTGITGLGGKKKKIDITNFDSVKYTEHAPGLIDAGEASFDLIWSFTLANQLLVQSLTEASTSRSFFLASSDGVTAPTFDVATSLLKPPNSGGLITRSGFLFFGYFSMFQIDEATDDVIKVKSGVQASGAIVTYAKGHAYP